MHTSIRISLIAAILLATLRLNAFGDNHLQRVITADSLSGSWEDSAGFSPRFDSDGSGDSNWWSEFGDPVLDSLLVVGEKNNYNVLMATRRMEIARQTLNEVRSLYYPGFDLSAGWTKSRTAGAMTGSGMKSTDMSYFSAGIDMSWQIDLFGKISAQARQQKNNVRVSRAERDGALLSLRSSIASSYISLRLLQAQQIVANEHLASQKKVFDIATARYEAGLASKLDVAQAATVYYSTMATLPQLESSITSTRNAIAVLLGEIPGQTFAALDKAAPLPDYRRLISIGLPLDLLRRRPDIAAAEASLAAAADGVGIAKKDYLPTLTLNGSIGTNARSAKDLFGSNSLSYSIAPTLSWTIFDGFKRKYEVAAAREQMEAEIDNYNLTVITAVADVNNAMTAYSRALREIDYYAKVMEESQKAVELSVDLYRGGLTSFNNVAQAQTDYLASTNSWLTARGKALSSLVTLYEALGGGWTTDDLLNGN